MRYLFLIFSLMLSYESLAGDVHMCTPIINCEYYSIRVVMLSHGSYQCHKLNSSQTAAYRCVRDQLFYTDKTCEEVSKNLIDNTIIFGTATVEITLLDCAKEKK